MSAVRAELGRGPRARSAAALVASLAGALAGCSAAHSQPDAGLDATRPCSTQRSATLAVVTNFDNGELNGVHTETTLALVDRLLRGDADGDGIAEEPPLERVRVLTTPNEAVRSRAADLLDCSVVTYGGAWTSTLLDDRCPESPRAGHPVFDIEPGELYEDELRCFLYAEFDRDGQCAGLTFDAALAAFSPRDASVDLTPLVGLGDTTNAAYRERDDVLVVVFQSGVQHDDCSRRTHERPPEGVCDGPSDHPLCCEENLAPVTRTSSALRTILSGRSVVYAGYVQFASFDPATQPLSALEALLSDPPNDCAYAGRLHTRTARLARELYPDMHLVPITCGAATTGGVPDVTALARHVFASICE